MFTKGELLFLNIATSSSSVILNLHNAFSYRLSPLRSGLSLSIIDFNVVLMNVCSNICSLLRVFNSSGSVLIIALSVISRLF